MAPAMNYTKSCTRRLACRCSRNRRCGSAIEAAKFTSEEANGLAARDGDLRNVGTNRKFESKMVNNMIAAATIRRLRKSCFDQIKGFGSYGFPESHAASFAQLVYVSSWLKHFHPMRFAVDC